MQGLELLAPLRFAHRLLAAQLATVAAKATPELVLYEASGIVQLPNNLQVDLSRRGPMRLIVVALFKQRLDAAGKPMSLDFHIQ